MFRVRVFAISLVVLLISVAEAQVRRNVEITKTWWGQNIQQDLNKTTLVDFNLKLKNQSGKTIEAVRWEFVIIDEYEDQVFKRLSFRFGALDFKSGKEKKLTREYDFPENFEGKRDRYTTALAMITITYEDGSEEFIKGNSKYLSLFDILRQ